MIVKYKGWVIYTLLRGGYEITGWSKCVPRHPVTDDVMIKFGYTTEFVTLLDAIL